MYDCKESADTSFTIDAISASRLIMLCEKENETIHDNASTKNIFLIIRELRFKDKEEDYLLDKL